MFYVTTLEHEIVLEPVYFGPKLRATIVRLLKEEVEGLVSHLKKEERGPYLLQAANSCPHDDRHLQRTDMWSM